MTSLVYRFVLFAAVIYTTTCEDAFLPSYIKPCSLAKDNFSGCVMEQIVDALPLFAKGVPELGVPSIDPVHINDVVIDGSGLKLTFSDAAMHGLSTSKLIDFKIHLGKVDETFELTFKADLKLIAQYEADGKILILPIQGKGDAVVDAKGVEVYIASKLEHTKDSKGEHLKLLTPTYKYTIEKTVFDLKNLFNGNKQLAETTLQFANENWQQLMDELSPPVIKQIVKTAIKSINKFFAGVTIKQIIPDYAKES